MSGPARNSSDVDELHAFAKGCTREEQELWEEEMPPPLPAQVDAVRSGFSGISAITNPDFIGKGNLYPNLNILDVIKDDDDGDDTDYTDGVSAGPTVTSRTATIVSRQEMDEIEHLVRKSVQSLTAVKKVDSTDQRTERERQLMDESSGLQLGDIEDLVLRRAKEQEKKHSTGVPLTPGAVPVGAVRRVASGPMLDESSGLQIEDVQDLVLSRAKEREKMPTAESGVPLKPGAVRMSAGSHDEQDHKMSKESFEEDVLNNPRFQKEKEETSSKSDPQGNQDPQDPQGAGAAATNTQALPGAFPHGSSPSFGAMNSDSSQDNDMISTRSSHTASSKKSNSTLSSNGLVRARPVVDESMQSNLQVAEPGSGEAKQYPTTPRYVLHLTYITAIILVAVGISLGAYFGGGHHKNEETTSIPETNATQVASLSREKEAEDIWNRIALESKEFDWLAEDTEGVFEEPPASLPSYLQALVWMVREDPLQLSYESDHLLQRFFLAYFYFTTTRDHPWASCNPPDESSSNDWCYYQQFVTDGLYRAVNGLTHHLTDYEETLAARWLSGQHECQWAGIFCNQDQQVESFHLDGLNLTGTLPDQFLFLESLQSVSLIENTLEGPLPASLATAKNLSHVNLENNVLTGAIPMEWWALSELEYLNVQKNEVQLGALPGEIRGMTSLKYLLVTSSGITGTLPMEFFQLTNLEWLYLFDNWVTGTIPTQTGMLSNLRLLSLDYNGALTGTIPTEIGKLTGLVELAASYTELNGTIPEELFSEKFEDLKLITFQNCRLSGTLSTLVGQLTDLKYLYLKRNLDMVGTLPSELGRLTGLRTLNVAYTSMTGSVPEELCELRGDNLLDKLTAQCLPYENGTASDMSCQEGCCTKCCNSHDRQCKKTGY